MRYVRGSNSLDSQDGQIEEVLTGSVYTAQFKLNIKREAGWVAILLPEFIVVFYLDTLVG